VICRHCGRELAERVVFCPYCGAVLAEPTAQKAPNPMLQPGSKLVPPGYPPVKTSLLSKTIAIVIAIVSVAGLTSFGFLFLGGDAPMGTYMCDYGATSRGQSIKISFFGPSMTLHSIAGTYYNHFTGKYKVEGGRLFFWPDDGVFLLNAFYYVSGDHIVMNYAKGSNSIWLDGVEFRKQ
jgi:hypothetical protein